MFRHIFNHMKGKLHPERLVTLIFSSRQHHRSQKNPLVKPLLKTPMVGQGHSLIIIRHRRPASLSITVSNRPRPLVIPGVLRGVEAVGDHQFRQTRSVRAMTLGAAEGMITLINGNAILSDSPVEILNGEVSNRRNIRACI